MKIGIEELYNIILYNVELAQTALSTMLHSTCDNTYVYCV